MIPKSILVFGEPKKSKLDAPISSPYSSPEYYQDDEYSMPEIPEQPEKPIFGRFHNAAVNPIILAHHQNRYNTRIKSYKVNYLFSALVNYFLDNLLKIPVLSLNCFLVQLLAFSLALLLA